MPPEIRAAAILILTLLLLTVVGVAQAAKTPLPEGCRLVPHPWGEAAGQPEYRAALYCQDKDGKPQLVKVFYQPKDVT